MSKDERKRFLSGFGFLDSRRRKGQHRQNLTRPLCMMPLELVEIVSASLEPVDLCSLRFTCKMLYMKTMNLFGTRCLQTVRTDLSAESIQKLSQISKNGQLKDHIRCLSISGTREKPLGCGYSWRRLDSHPQLHLLDRQPCSQQLQGILLALTNCRSFEIRRYAGGPDTEITCLSDMELDYTVPYWFDGCLTPGDAITMMLNIIAELCLPVRSFLVDIRPPNVSEGSYGDPARRYAMNDRMLGLTTNWSGLQELTIKRSLSPGLGDWVIGLVRNASNLQTFRLELGHCFEGDTLISRLSVVSDALPQLREFELENASLSTPDSLIRLLHHSRHKLQNLCFRNVIIKTSDGLVRVIRTLENGFAPLTSFNIDRVVVKENAITYPKLSDDTPPSVPSGVRLTFSHYGQPWEPRKYYVVFFSAEMECGITALGDLIEHFQGL
ncbi:hypothetical protein FQN54_001345 [Arachnomyces sp. PD_36]|nr:hypothetical protein FQN54_001345 [Arachnomyces sp. PD_36]